MDIDIQLYLHHSKYTFNAWNSDIWIPNVDEITSATLVLTKRELEQVNWINYAKTGRQYVL